MNKEQSMFLEKKDLTTDWKSVQKLSKYIYLNQLRIKITRLQISVIKT